MRSRGVGARRTVRQSLKQPVRPAKHSALPEKQEPRPFPAGVSRWVRLRGVFALFRSTHRLRAVGADRSGSLSRSLPGRHSSRDLTDRGDLRIVVGFEVSFDSRRLEDPVATGSRSSVPSFPASDGSLQPSPSF